MRFVLGTKFGRKWWVWNLVFGLANPSWFAAFRVLKRLTTHSYKRTHTHAHTRTHTHKNPCIYRLSLCLPRKPTTVIFCQSCFLTCNSFSWALHDKPMPLCATAGFCSRASSISCTRYPLGLGLFYKRRTCWAHMQILHLLVQRCWLAKYCAWWVGLPEPYLVVYHVYLCNLSVVITKRLYTICKQSM